ncbi:MAG: hypothetical protein JWN46_2386 [Acidimicrobiales bacterium]|nr:hypothetical protein [Acidimicrobiales bacterium]
MDVSLLGVRGSTPSPGPAFDRYGGNTSCVAVSHDGEPPTLLLDCGTGARRLGTVLGGAPFRGVVLLTHLHWDHTHGLPFAPALDRPDAEVELWLPGQPHGDALAVLSRAMSPPHFPITPDELRGRWQFWSLEPGVTKLAGFEVTAAEVPHKGGRTFGYRVSDGRSVLTYIPDHGPSALGPGPDGLGERHPAALGLAAGADLLLHDAQHTRDELPARASFGHSAIDYAIDLGAQAGVTTVGLFHHDPARTDDELDAIAAAHAADDRPRVIVAAEDRMIRL